MRLKTVMRFDVLMTALVIMLLSIAIVGCPAPTEPAGLERIDTGCYHTYLNPENPSQFLRDTIPCPTRADINADLRRRAVVSQALLYGADTTRMLRLSRRENDTGLPWAWSSTWCCTGIMQVNVTHLADFWEECTTTESADATYADSVQALQEHRTNACYGVNIWLDKLAMCRGNPRCALRRYVGATTPENVPRGYIEAILD